MSGCPFPQKKVFLDGGSLAEVSLWRSSAERGVPGAQPPGGGVPRGGGGNLVENFRSPYFTSFWSLETPFVLFACSIR